MADEFTKQYAPPSYISLDGRFESYDKEVIAWLDKNHTDSRSYLRSNRGWKSADICMGIYYGDETERIPRGLSKLSVKKLRRQAREAVANVANMRYTWQHKSRKKQYQPQAEKLDELRDDWTYTQDLYHKLEEAGAYAAGGGTGYIWLWPKFDKATGENEICPVVLDWKQVLPFHAGRDANPDNLYGLSIHMEYPVPEAHALFPNHIDIIKQDRNVPSNFARNWSSVSRTFKGVFNRLTGNRQAIAQDPYPVSDIFYTWVRDDSKNETGAPILMGEEGAHNSYLVQPGKKLFPYMRMITSSNLGIIQDGVPKYINAHVPISPFKFEHVAGEWLGMNIIRDGRRLEETNNNIMRSFEDAIRGRRQPPLGVSDKLPKSIRQQLRTNSAMLIGKIFEYSPQLLKEAIVALLPPDFYNVAQAEVDFLKFNQEQSDYMMGTADSSFMSKLNQMPAADTQEAFLRSLGTLATSHSRSFEESLIRLAKIWVWFAPQVYTVDRIITKLGTDGILEALDFDANSLVPKPEDYSVTDANNSGLSYAQRLHQHIKNFSIYAAPNSLQERMSQTNKLTTLQLVKLGVEIPNELLYNTFRDDGEYLINKKKWFAEQIEKIKITAILQKALAEANAAADPQNQLAQGLLDTIKGQNGGEGRPPNNDAPPRLESKTEPDGTQRGTVATN